MIFISPRSLSAILRKTGDMVKCWGWSPLEKAFPDHPSCMSGTLILSFSVASGKEKARSTFSKTDGCLFRRDQNIPGRSPREAITSMMHIPRFPDSCGSLGDLNIPKILRRAGPSSFETYRDHPNSFGRIYSSSSSCSHPSPKSYS